MKRREAIKRTAFLLGYSVSAAAVTGVLAGCNADTKTSEEGWKPKAFSDVQMNTIKEASERILPATEGVIGAKDVMVDRFIDELYFSYFKPDKIAAFKKGLDGLEEEAKANYNNSFASLNNEQMDEVLTKVAEQAVIEEKAKEDMGPTASIERKDIINPFFFDLKEATLLGYFTSEKVGMSVLNFDPIPTEYNGCVPITDIPNGRLWSI